MANSFDNAYPLPVSSAWEASVSSMTDRRRNSISSTNDESRRNSLLSLSMFDLPHFGFGNGGTLSTRNSIGLGGTSSILYNGLSESDPFAPFSFNDIPMLPLTNNEIQQMQAIQHNQQQQNNIGNLSTLLNLTNNGAFRRGSFDFGGFGSFGMNPLSNASNKVLDRLLGDRSEASDETAASVATLSTNASMSSASTTTSILRNHQEQQIQNYQQQQEEQQQKKQPQQLPDQAGDILSRSFGLGPFSGNENFTAASIFQHLQNEDQYRQSQHDLRRSSLGLYGFYAKSTPITQLASMSSDTLLTDPVSSKEIVSTSAFGVRSGPINSSVKSNEVGNEKEKSLLEFDPVQQEEIQQETLPPAMPATSNTLRRVASASGSISEDCVDDDDVDDDDEDNQNRFKPFHEEKWTLRYKELLDFHRENGHAAVPHTYPPNPQLARWVKRQRRQYKLRKDSRQSTMTSERLDLLNDVGFIWDSHDVNWREKLDCLLNFRTEHNHCNVPSNFRDKKLATWVKCQRRQYKLYWDTKPSAMTPQRIQELEKIGFEWEIRSILPRPPGMNTTGLPHTSIPIFDISSVDESNMQDSPNGSKSRGGWV